MPLLGKHTNPIAGAKAATMQATNMLIVLLLALNYIIAMPYIHWGRVVASTVGLAVVVPAGKESCDPYHSASQSTFPSLHYWRALLARLAPSS